MAEIEYKVVEGKNIESFREQLGQEGGQGWRVVSMAVGGWGENPAGRYKQRGVDCYFLVEVVG